MSSATKLSNKSLQAYNDVYDTQREDVAFETRGEFLRAFPLRRLTALKLDDYVIGLQRPTFCSYVEAESPRFF